MIPFIPLYLCLLFFWSSLELGCSCLCLYMAAESDPRARRREGSWHKICTLHLVNTCCCRCCYFVLLDFGRRFGRLAAGKEKVASHRISALDHSPVALYYTAHIISIASDKLWSQGYSHVIGPFVSLLQASKHPSSLRTAAVAQVAACFVLVLYLLLLV